MNDNDADEARAVKGRIEKTLLGEVWECNDTIRLLPFCIDVIKCLPDASHHQTLSFPDSKQNEGTLMTRCDAYTKRAAVLDVALTYLYEKDRKCELRAIVIVSYFALNK